MVNSFRPSNWTDALAVAATAAEILLGIGLILGIYPRLVSLASAGLLSLFAFFNDPLDRLCASMMRLDAPALIADAAPVPNPGRGEILVRIFAAGVTPTELLWLPDNSHARDGSKRSGAVPGDEFSGNHRSSRQRGRVRPDPSRDLWEMNDRFVEGASAEYCISTTRWRGITCTTWENKT